MTEAAANNKWHFNRQVNLSFLVQLLFLASLIIGTWANLQKQLCIMQHDINRLVNSQESLGKKCNRLPKKALGSNTVYRRWKNKSARN